MKFMIMIAASAASAALVLPTVTQAQESSVAKQVHLAASSVAKDLRA
jgi:hypothetical protein